MRIAAALMLCLFMAVPAHAHSPRHSPPTSPDLPLRHVAAHCVGTNAGKWVCGVAGKRASNRQRVIAMARTLRLIPHPRGCPSRAFCACGLARFWGIWRPALNLVANWARAFRHVIGPDIGIAAIRRDRHHIMGIIAGKPGHWRVVDFNSGRHLSRVRIVSDFSGYFFVDPREKISRQ